MTSLRYASQAERAAFLARWADDLSARIGSREEGPGGDKGTLWVLDEGGQFAGHLWLVKRDDPLTGQRLLWVTSVGVVARHRSRGFGRELMKKALDEAAREGLDSVGLHVDADNVVARKLYEEMGFETRRLQMRRALRR